MNKFKKGFTLVELMIAMVVGAIIMAAIYAMINLGQGSSAGVGRRVMTQQDSRAVMDLMAMEISMVSFNPNMVTTTWLNSNNSCACIVMTQARSGIQVANTTQVGLAMDLDNSTSICNTNNEYILYTYNSGDRTITRSTNCGGNQVILGGTAAGSSTMVRNADTNPVTPLLQYFNIAGTDISANVIATPDTSIPLIRRIRINIIADDQIADAQGGGFKVSRKTYSTDVLVRNHAMAP